MVAATHPPPPCLPPLTLPGQQLCPSSWSIMNRFWEPGWAIKTTSSRYWESMLWLLLVITEVPTKRPGHLCCKPTATTTLWLKCLPRHLMGQCLPPFHFSPFGNHTLKIRIFEINCVYMGTIRKLPQIPSKRCRLRKALRIH